MLPRLVGMLLSLFACTIPLANAKELESVVHRSAADSAHDSTPLQYKIRKFIYNIKDQSVDARFYVENGVEYEVAPTIQCQGRPVKTEAHHGQDKAWPVISLHAASEGTVSPTSSRSSELSAGRQYASRLSEQGRHKEQLSGKASDLSTGTSSKSARGRFERTSTKAFRNVSRERRSTRHMYHCRRGALLVVSEFKHPSRKHDGSPYQATVTLNPATLAEHPIGVPVYAKGTEDGLGYTSDVTFELAEGEYRLSSPGQALLRKDTPGRKAVKQKNSFLRGIRQAMASFTSPNGGKIKGNGDGKGHSRTRSKGSIAGKKWRIPHFKGSSSADLLSR